MSENSSGLFYVMLIYQVNLTISVWLPRCANEAKDDGPRIVLGELFPTDFKLDELLRMGSISKY